MGLFGKKETDNCLGKGKFLHVAGLPLPPSTPCDVFLYDDKFTFITKNDTITLPLSKVMDVEVKSGNTIQNISVLTNGALIGLTKKDKFGGDNYFVITYEKEGQQSYISLDSMGRFYQVSIANAYKKLPKATRNIEL